MRKLARLLSFLRPYTLRFVLAVILMAMVGAFEALAALLIRPIFDQVLDPNGASRILLFRIPFLEQEIYLGEIMPVWIRDPWIIVAVAIVFVTVGKGLSEFVGTYSIHYVGQAVVRDLRNLLYSRTIHRSIAFFFKNPTGRLMSAITSDIEKIQHAVSQVAADFLKQSFTLLGLLGVLFYLDWKLAVVSLVVVPLVIFPSARIGRSIRITTRSSQDKMGEMNSILQETFTGNRIVKAFGMESFEIGKFKMAAQRLFQTNLRWIRAHALTPPLMEFLGAITIALLLLYARNEILRNTQTAGGFVAFLYALIKMYTPVKRLTGVNNAFQQAVGASEKVFEYLDVTDEVKEKPGAVEISPFTGSLVFEKVNFHYGEGTPLLRDVNLHVPAGTVVAIVGSSGAGKTTLVNLIPRFFDVTGGRVLIDGVDVRDATVKSLRRQVSMVAQETILFNDTVFNNICYGRPPTCEERVMVAARAALAHEFIVQLPQGYQTILGEQGQRLSGGQRQRIAIARALMKDAPILILDEATSELDSESELLVQQALANLMAGRTVFVIAHRLSTIRGADRIIVLEGGAISDVGTHADLLSRAGTYRKLHELQFAPTQA